MASNEIDAFEEEAVDDVTMDPDETGEKEAVDILKPYLTDSSDEGEKALRDRLLSLGVSATSHITMLKEEDLANIITPIQFRVMISKFNSDNSGSKGKTTTDKNLFSYKLDLKSLISKSFYDKLEEDGEILSKQDRRKLVVVLADDIRENVKIIRKKDVLAISRSIVKKYPTSLGCLMKDEADITETAMGLSISIRSHIFYIKSTKRASDDFDTPSKRSFTKAASNGLNPERDLPNSLPEGETLETQEAKRLVMVEMESSGASLNFNVIKKLMAETYCSQRSDINEHLTMDKLLKKWPFIGMHSVLQDHFEQLKEVNVAESLQETEILLTNFEKFFEAESHKKRKGNSAKITEGLREILLKYKRSSDDESNQSSKHFIAMVLCAMLYMEVPSDKVLVLFEETASFDEVQASPNLPDHPAIAVLGNDPQDNPLAYIVVDKRIISEKQITVSKALHALLMCYYVFKVEYPTVIAPLLHFLQRKIFNITDEGTRTERKKSKRGYIGAPPPIPNMLIRLMRHFKQYCSEWDVE